MPTRPAVSALNHLLAQNPWALPRLARFGGRTVRFGVAPLSFSFTIQQDGTLHASAHGASADAACTASPAILPRLALRDESALQDVAVSGDAALVEEILFLARNLRWDAAEDLSRFTGDIAAERIVQLAHAAGQQARKTAANLSESLAEYWTEEQPLIAAPRNLASFAQGVARLHDSIEVLEQRIQQATKAK